MGPIVLLRVSGRDRPGLTASLTGVLARYDVEVLDIGQAVIHDTLSLGILARLPSGADADALLAELGETAARLGVDLSATPVSADRYRGWVAEQERARFVVTLLGPRIAAEHISRVASVVAEAGLNIDDISRLSGRVPLESDAARPPRACLELALRGGPVDVEALRTRLLRLSGELGIDVAFQIDGPHRRSRRLVAFDMDSTLVACEIVDELAAARGVGAEVAAITAAAMAGELDFEESLRRRVALLRGTPVALLERIAEGLPLTEGAEALLPRLRALGYKTALLSGGFLFFARRLARRLGIDYVYANELEIEGGVLTGRLVGPLVDGPRKAELLRTIARAEGIPMEQVIAVGDGANDLPMLNAAGLGIAFQAKPVVREGAGQSISTVGLDGILFLMGIRDREASRLGTGTDFVLNEKDSA